MSPSIRTNCVPRIFLLGLHFCVWYCSTCSRKFAHAISKQVIWGRSIFHCLIIIAVVIIIMLMINIIMLMINIIIIIVIIIVTFIIIIIITMIIICIIYMPLVFLLMLAWWLPKLQVWLWGNMITRESLYTILRCRVLIVIIFRALGWQWHHWLYEFRLNFAFVVWKLARFAARNHIYCSVYWVNMSGRKRIAWQISLKSKWTSTQTRDFDPQKANITTCKMSNHWSQFDNTT